MQLLSIADEIFDEELEFDCLDKGDIGAMSDMLCETYLQENVSVLSSGYYSRAVLRNARSVNVTDCKPPEFDWYGNQTYDTILFTNPVLIKDALAEELKLKLLVKRIKGRFIFAVPFFCNAQNHFSLFLHKGFSSTEEENGEYSCWYADSENNTARLILYNHSQSPLTVRIKFHLYCLDVSAIVQIKLPGGGRTYHDQLIFFDEELCLYPGPNAIDIFHIGYTHPAPRIYTQDEGDIRPLKFKLSGFVVALCRPDGIQKEIQGEVLFENRVDSAFYQYCFDPDWIYARLHNHGFFEIDTFFSCKDFGISFDQTTRFLAWDRKFHVKNDNQSNHQFRIARNQNVGQLVFVANRKGVLDE
jgi:hypothetical protein